LDEIKEWAIADESRRRTILHNAQQRRRAHQLSGQYSPH
jgi:hypothetical protein